MSGKQQALAVLIPLVSAVLAVLLSFSNAWTGARQAMQLHYGRKAARNVYQDVPDVLFLPIAQLRVFNPSIFEAMALDIEYRPTMVLNESTFATLDMSTPVIESRELQSVQADLKSPVFQIDALMRNGPHWRWMIVPTRTGNHFLVVQVLNSEALPYQIAEITLPIDIVPSSWSVLTFLRLPIILVAAGITFVGYMILRFVFRSWTQSHLTYVNLCATSNIHRIFISYSSEDETFATHIRTDLHANGVHCWFAFKDIQGGKKIHEQIDQAIRVSDRLLLILSAASMNSEWVKTEIAKARQREVLEKRQMLFPISLVPYEQLRGWRAFDADTGKDSAREVREYFIPDFSNWNDHDSYQKAFERLLQDLRDSNS